ncbi:T9SS type A sorting domain-containing protein [bacterium SCSIO 12643]|nr:T9SS type A sorting domain-containing protein [bacterium SCSIO 12643]
MRKNHLIKIYALLVLVAWGFSVSAQTVSAPPFTETFDNTSVPVGWSNTSSTGNTSYKALWRLSGHPGFAMNGTVDHTGNGGSFAWVDGSSPNNLISILETDTVNINGFINPKLRFWLKSDITGYNTTFNTFSVDVFDGATWHTGVFTFANNTANRDWEQFSIPLSAYTFSGPPKFRFNVNQNGSTPYFNDIALDDIEVFSDLVNNSGLTAVLNPELPGCTLDSVVTVELKNYGSGNLTSAQINWSINGNLQMPYSWTGSLATNDLDTVVVGTNSNIAFGDTIDVWTSMPNGVTDSSTYNDSTQLVYTQGYSGVITIDPSGAGDFVSFTDAINSLSAYGVCGNLIVEAVNGTYTEQLNLSTFPGMSSMNTLTFRSQSGNADSVVISYISSGSSDNYILKFDHVSNILVENMTFQNLGPSYSRVVTASGGNKNITIDGCKWIGMPTTNGSNGNQYVSYINGGGNDNWTIRNNTIINGNYGLYFYGTNGNYGENNVIERNEFVDQWYISANFYYQDDGLFTENHAISNSTHPSGSSFFIGGARRIEISNNHVEGTVNWPSTGLYLASVKGDLNASVSIYNNRVVMPKPNAWRGIYASDLLFVEFAHNSVYMNSTSTFNSALYFSGGSFNKVKNNIFINGGSGAAVYISGSGVYEMDYNNISAPNGGDIGYRGGTTYATLSDWVTGIGFDSNSVNVNDVISDTSSFKVCNDSLWAVGTYLSAYAMDYQGEVRQDPPCIGADEFMPTSQFGFSDLVLCNGDTLTLVQEYFDTVVWNATDTSNTYDITAPATQQVSVYDLCGSDTSVFDVMPQQVAVVGDTNLCEGTSATLNTGISGGTYLWSNDVNSNTLTDSVIIVDSAMTVYVEVVDMYGCSSMDTAIVTQSMDVVLADTASFCEGANVVLDANMQGTYLWSDGSTNQTLSVTAPGIYSVTVTDQNCVSSASTNVSEILNAIASFSTSSSLYTAVFTNTSQNGVSYLWNFGDGTTSTYENPTHAFSNTNEDSLCYVVTLEVTNSCGAATYTDYCVKVGKSVNPLSISEVELASLISVYPNPNAGIFTVNVKSDESKDMSIEVLDVRGAQVFVQSYGKINGEVNRTVNLEGVAQGIYFVKVTLDGETAVYRISVN